ncbi:MAG: hypothetical protein LBV68_06945 [Spirochaetaceae bacterium]|jgi:hypothetical protein|nr:hypothetical protein [Spirochaetaceae bacterium]
MSFKSSLAFSILLALVPPVLFLVFYNNTGGRQSPPPYVTLVLDERVNERNVTSLLNKHNIKHFISESTTKVFLNDFDSIKEVSLDEYTQRLEPFDPRNDGYAAKVRSIFVAEGLRRIFIPNRDLNGFGASPEKKIVEALEGTEYKAIDIQSRRHNNTIAFILFGFAAFLMVVTARKNAIDSHNPFKLWYILAVLPSLALLVPAGSPGFALAAVSLALFQSTQGTLLSFLITLRYKQGGPFAEKDLQTKDRSHPLDIKRILLDAFLPDLPLIIPLTFLFIVICLIGEISFARAACFSLFLFLSFFSMSFAESRRGKVTRHIPFVFIPIRLNTQKKYPLLPAPFIAAFIIQIIVSSSGQTAVIEDGPLDFTVFNQENVLVSETDYKKHFEFQKNFAHRNLNTSETSDKETLPYLHYNLGADGLILSAEAYYQKDNDPIKPWTLGPLVAFLGGGAPSGEITLATREIPGPQSLLTGFLALSLYIPYAFLRHRKKIPFLLYNDK